MGRNTLNLLVALTLILLVSACFWRSDKNYSASSDEPDLSNANTAPFVPAPVSAKPVGEKRPDDGDFIVEHLKVNTPRYVEIDREVQREKLLTKAADKLNRALILPQNIYLRTKDCKESNAFYDSRDRSVTMCYELMEHFFRTFKSAGSSEQVAYGKMFDAVKFVFLHEMGHALIDAYKIPVAGNEEDAADRLSSFVNLTELGEEGVRAVLAAAEAFEIESRAKTTEKRRMADEHLLQEQRFYNSLCMIYGSNPSRYANFVTDGFLPKERAARCPNEYQRTVDSWMSLLEPWRKN